MSGEVIATPVAKYGRSSEFGVVLDFIQTIQARTTYPIILNLRNGEKSLVEVKCENPKDDAVETFLNQVTAHLPKEEGTPISKTPVNVTLQGKIYYFN